MKIEMRKMTDVGFLREMNEFTSGKQSKQSLTSAYKHKHSTIRTQIFVVKCYDIPQYVAYHLRTHFSLYMVAPSEYGWMRSKRTDKGGLDFQKYCSGVMVDLSEADMCISRGEKNEAQHYIDLAYNAVDDMPQKFDRMAPTNFAFMISAEGLMTLAETRLCIGAVSKETRETVEAICQLVEECDPDLYPHLKKPCVLHGICREGGCGYMTTDKYRVERKLYKSMFKPKV